MGSLLIKCVVLALSAVLLSLGGASAMGLPPPLPIVNFTIGVQGVVWCKSCRYPGYFQPMDASPLPGLSLRHSLFFSLLKNIETNTRDACHAC